MSARYEGWPVQFAALAALTSFTETGPFCFVWPDEGEFVNEKFVFNAGHQNFEPLMIDMQTANMLVTIHDALKQENKVKFERMVAADRGSFALLVEFGWKQVKIGAKDGN